MDTNYTGFTVHPQNKEREKYFVSLMNENKGFLIYLINSYSFVKDRSDANDYYQQIMLYAWLRFAKYQPHPEYTFTTWIRRTAKWAILQYYNNYKQHKAKILYEENIASWYDEADSIYNEEHIEALHSAINALPDDKKEVVQMFLNEEDLRKKSIELGHRHNYLNGKMSSIRKLLLDNRHKHFPGMRVAERKLTVIPSEYRNERHWASKPVEMLDMEGKFIKLFPSTMEAERQGFNAKNIHAVCNGKCLSSRGYKWRYQGEQRSFVLNRKAKASGNPNKPKRPIDQLDLDGNYLKTYPSTYATKVDGFTSTLVSKVLKKKVHTHGGFKWRYSDEKSQNIQKQTA